MNPNYDEERPIEPGPAWLGPKASEDDVPVVRRFGGGLTLRAVLPNAITAAALCSGLTGIRFAIAAAYGHEGDWQKALDKNTEGTGYKPNSKTNPPKLADTCA